MAKTITAKTLPAKARKAYRDLLASEAALQDALANPGATTTAQKLGLLADAQLNTIAVIKLIAKHLNGDN